MKFIAYLRVSTSRQGESGLGVGAQLETIRAMISKRDGVLLHTYEEHETGTNKRTRPVLKEALAKCKEEEAILIVARLDRLARNLNFLTSVIESGQEILFCDMPGANLMMIQFMGMLAEYEAKNISRNCREALQIKKAQLAEKGLKLGTPSNFKDEHRKKGAMANRQKA